MINRIAFIGMLAFFCTTICTAQNFSGLQNKKLTKVDDLGTALESLIGRLGGSVDGTIDSVVVIEDYEKEIRLKIYYTNFANAYFTVSTMTESRQREAQVEIVKFSQPGRNSPAECVLRLNSTVPKESLQESQYLRIDIARKPDGGGKVKVFSLRKKWKMEGGPSASNSNMLIRAVLQPVGVAANLNPASDNGVMPAKNIRFNKALLNVTDEKIRKPPVKTTGGNSFTERVSYKKFYAFDNVSGTWVNKVTTTNGYSRMIITNNNHISLYWRSGSRETPASAPLTTISPNKFRAQFAGDGKAETVNTKSELDITLLNNNEMAVKITTLIKSFFSTSRKTYDYTFMRQIQPGQVDPKIHTIDQWLFVMPEKTPPGPVSTEPLGPGASDIVNLWDGIAVDNLIDFKDPQEISNINMTVIPDKNPNSGLYYFLPADFHLIWDPAVKAKKGYGLTISYGKQTEAEADANADAPVNMSAILTAGISSKEKSFVRALLKSKFPNFKDIRPLPLRENIQTTFQNTLGALYNIPAEKITVTSGTDFTNTIKVAWSTNSDTKEFIQTALTSGEGIVASVILKPKNEEITEQQIPASISLADTRPFGKMNLEPLTWRTKEWKNATSYPLRLKYLHVLKQSKQGNNPIIYSWSMDNMEVPSLASVSFENNPVPLWLDNDPSSVMWLDYSVMDCRECNDTVITAVTDGVSGSTVQQIKFIIPKAVFDTLKADYFMIYVRSSQVDPKGEMVKELPVLNITNEPGKNFLVGPLFIPKGGSPDFEFNIKVSSTDGEFYLSDKWIKTSEKEVLLGKSRVIEIFKGIIPGIN